MVVMCYDIVIIKNDRRTLGIPNATLDTEYDYSSIEY